MSRRGPRGLTSEEQELWNKVRERTAPLHPERPAHKPQQLLRSKPPAPKPDIPLFQIGQSRTETALPQSQPSDVSDHVSSSAAANGPEQFWKAEARQTFTRGAVRPARNDPCPGASSLVPVHPGQPRPAAASGACHYRKRKTTRRRRSDSDPSRHFTPSGPALAAQSALVAACPTSHRSTSETWRRRRLLRLPTTVPAVTVAHGGRQR